MMRCVVLLVCLALRVAAAEENLQQISAAALSLNSAVGLSSSGRFVAVQDEQGGLWLRDMRSGRNKQISKGGAKASFSWSPDEKYLYVVQAGKAEVYELGSGRWRGGLAGSAPVSDLEVSPDGRSAAFVRDNNLWVAGVEGRRLRPLTKTGGGNVLIGTPDPVFAREFQVSRHYWWSPDSAAIAFIEMEFKTADHYVTPGAPLPVFRLKIIDVAKGEARTVFESSEQWPYLLRVVWHPDGKRVAFYRINRLQTQAELCLFDDGVIKTLLTEKDAYWVNAPETPVFVESGKRVIVSSERSGGRHVYLYELDGTLVRDLAPGDLEVYRLHGEAGSKGGVFVSGSKGNKQEQQLFRLDTAGGAPEQVTQEAGWHEVSMSAGGNAYLDRYSSAIKPPAVWWHGENSAAREVEHAAAMQAPIANDFFTIKTHDKVELPARLFKPGDFDAGKKYPMILYTFSGPGGRVVQDAWDGWQMAWNRYMVDKGYLVLAVDVRGSGGYGHLFEEYIHYRFGAQEVADLREVVSYLRRQSYVDAARLGIWGCDYGAHTVVHAMLQFAGGFKAGVADAPIIEWTGYNAYFAERYLGMPGKRRTEYDDSTALDDAMRMTGTLLVIGSDKNPFIRSDQVEALQKAFAEVKRNKEVIKRLHVANLEDADYREHPEELAKLMEQMAAFFQQTL